MEFNRNHFVVLGTVLLLVGIQFRFIDSFVLNEKSSRFIAERIERKSRTTIATNPFPNLLNVMSSPQRTVNPPQTVNPPRWLGWSFISVGAVLMLHSLAMRRPE